jgi:hypothetical protein
MTEAEMLQRWIAAADDVALALAYESDLKVDTELARMRRNLIDKFCALFPSAERETMAAGVDSIIVNIRERKREIERDAITADRSKSN